MGVGGHFVMGTYERGGRGWSGDINLPPRLFAPLSQLSWWLADPRPSRCSSINQPANMEAAASPLCSSPAQKLLIARFIMRFMFYPWRQPASH